ncbi:hypothetical protein ACKW6Q_05980 [Chryseobacterium kwangjuense]|uniref:Uncharacterized protein n=1 Tax=Chryseobacterium kwangjuense TaxID=267125 RepID=A0ABW9K224_9FLAO
MKITTPKGWIIEFLRFAEPWQSHEYFTNIEGSVITEKAVFLFEDHFYREYAKPSDFEKELGRFIDFYLDNREMILLKTKTAVNGIMVHNHDFVDRDDVNYIISHIEILYLKRYEFKIHFVFLYGYVSYEIFFEVLSPENFVINKIERILNH